MFNLCLLCINCCFSTVWVNLIIWFHLFLKVKPLLYIGETPLFNIYLTLQNTLIHFWDYLKHKIFPFLKKFSRKIKIFTLLIINQLHLYKQPYTLIDIKEWAYEKIFADSVVTVHRPLQYCGVRFEKRISSRTSQKLARELWHIDA